MLTCNFGNIESFFKKVCKILLWCKTGLYDLYAVLTDRSTFIAGFTFIMYCRMACHVATFFFNNLVHTANETARHHNKHQFLLTVSCTENHTRP
jgi:hypothetical protein